MSDEKRPRGRPRNDNSELPLPAMVERRWVWPRSQIETLRRVLAAKKKKPGKAAKVGGDLVTISELAAELGLARRTVTKRVDDARAAKAAGGGARKRP